MKKKIPANAPTTSLDLLWGRDESTRRGPKPTLTTEAIAAAAIRIANAEGLAAVTMSRVASELGVTTMASYRHVPGKEELVNHMADLALGAPPDIGGLDWRDGLARWARAELVQLQRNPWLLQALLGRVVMGPNWAAWLDRALRAVAGLKLSPAQSLAAVFLVEGHVRATAQISFGAAGSSAWAANFARVLELIRGDPRYPALDGIARTGLFQPGSPDDDPFEFGLDRLLEGIATLRPRNPRPRPRAR